MEKRARRRSSKHAKAKREEESDSSGRSSDAETETLCESSDARRQRHKWKERKRRKREERRKRKREGERRRKGDSRREKEKGKRRERDERKRGASLDSDESFSESVENGDSKKRMNAVAIAVGIVENFPEITNDLEKLLEMIDNGQAVDISGIPNKELVASLKGLFRSLHLQRGQNGMYLLPENAHKKTLDIVGSFIREKSDLLVGKSQKVDSYDGLKLPRLPEDISNFEEAGFGPEASVGVEAATSTNPVPYGARDPNRRVIGPAMPSAEMLAAAARLTEASSALREAEEEYLECNPLIGPPPPAVVAEAESANEAERFEEITRILAPDVCNTYEVLGLKPNASFEVIKKRYWKLSLMVHPDKCSHPEAHRAFTVLNQAFKDLQDPVKKAAIDRKIEEQEAKVEYEAELKAQREAAQWRQIRGEAQPGDDILLGEGPKLPSRDEWMTVLPPERQAGPPSMHSTYFSKNEKSGRGDTSVWTDTPLEKAQKAKIQYLEAHKQAILTAPNNDTSIEIKHKAEIGEMLDKYNKLKRPISLVERNQVEFTKKTKKEKKALKQQQEDEWTGKHPWKPWDREKDLTTSRQSWKWDASSMTQGLASRFSSNQDRSFL